MCIWPFLFCFWTQCPEVEKGDNGEELFLKRKKYHFDERGSEGYVRLGNAIVEKAAWDYRKSLARLKLYPTDDKALDEARLIEKFFHSQLYGAITTADPDMIIKKLRGEYGL